MRKLASIVATGVFSFLLGGIAVFIWNSNKEVVDVAILEEGVTCLYEVMDKSSG